METLSVIGVIGSLALLMFLAMRGYSILVIAPFCAVLVALTSGIDLMEGLGEIYMEGLSGFVMQFFLIFMLGALFGKYMEDSGAARAIANGIMDVTGRDKPFRALITLMIICAVLTYGGVNLFVVVFAVIPMAKPIFKELNIHWSMVLAPIVLGAATFTMTMVPGTPAIQNIIPMEVLGTPATAAPVIGIVATIFTLAIGIYYIKKSLDKSQQAGLTFNEEDTAKGIASGSVEVDGHFPPVFMSVIPPILLLVVLNILDNVILALVAGIVISAILFMNYIPNQLPTINKGAANSIMPLLNTCAVVGFGSIVAATAGYELIAAYLMEMPGGPMVSLAVTTNLLAGVTGSASGGLAIALENLAPSFMEMGIGADVIHRISAIACGGLDALPHNGAVITLLLTAGISHREGYKHVFWVGVVAPVLATIPAVLLAIMLY